jgi:hypothetical protein
MNPFGVNHPVPATVDQLLLDILSTRRADGSAGDSNFRMWLQNQLKQIDQPFQVAERGNFIVTTDAASKTLFSCHIDTVHSQKESNGQKQKLIYDSIMGHIYLDPESNSSCLGADDGVGIYIMLKMIQERIPGTYVFHTGEECGGKGAHELLKHRKEWLSKFERAVAFDRPNDSEVIITQGGMPCASEEAGEDLASMLNDLGMSYTTSTRGVFTDTKVYAGVIPECFNLGVGYYQQHTNKETLNYAHAEALLNAACAIDWESLLTIRKPTAQIFPKARDYPKEYSFQAKKEAKPVEPVIPQFPSLFSELATYDEEELLVICEQTPEDAARMLMRMTAKVAGLQKELDTMYSMMGVQ